MRVALLAAAVVFAVAGCGTTKVVQKERVTTTTVTRLMPITISSPPKPSEPTVYVATQEGVLYKPNEISYYGGHQLVVRIRWITYGGPVATAKATFAYDTCKLGCAGGPYKYSPVTLKLLDRQLCHGSPAYTRWSISGAGLDPTPDLLWHVGDPCK